MNKFLTLLIIIIASIFNFGCDAGSVDPVSTQLSSEGGYKIQLASTVDRVSVGGQAVITAKIYEPDGSPIRDGETVMFTSSEGGSMSETETTTKNGQAMVTYTAGNIAMSFDNISASCMGAMANISIWVLPQTY